MKAEIEILQPRLVIPVGKLAIAQLYPDIDKLTEIIGELRRGELAGHRSTSSPCPIRPALRRGTGWSPARHCSRKRWH